MLDREGVPQGEAAVVGSISYRDFRRCPNWCAPTIFRGCRGLVTSLHPFSEGRWTKTFHQPNQREPSPHVFLETAAPISHVYRRHRQRSVPFGGAASKIKEHEIGLAGGAVRHGAGHWIRGVGEEITDADQKITLGPTSLANSPCC